MSVSNPETFTLSWSDVEAQLDNLKLVDGGFTFAKRGLVTLPDGNQVFVKLGLHENTKLWAKYEIGVYRFLHKHKYPHIPQLLAVNSDETGFVLSAYTPEDGWNWKDQWDNHRLDKTLEAVDALAAIQPVGEDHKFFTEKNLSVDDDGWAPLASSPQLQKSLTEKLLAINRDDISIAINFDTEAKTSSQFVFRQDELVHNDIRADNCAWNATKEEVCLVDWNWTELGDRRVDLSAALVHVQKSGFNILPKYANRLDPGALHWLAGFWFNAAASPIWPGGPAHLRDIQLSSAITSWDLSKKLL